jgi:serine/threonine-protein kinase
MATVHFGRMQGPVGFSLTVAIKCLHPQYARSPDFVAMFLDEARLAARIRHPNVVSTLDVVARDGELFVVMEYVSGESLSRLLKAAAKEGRRVPPAIVACIVGQALLGLHAAHEATDDRGEPLHVVHRDVSPQNILVGTDGVTRVLDFGIAKASSRIQSTDDGTLKGKVAYMSPEQLCQQPIDRRTDVFAAAVVLWEALTGKRLFAADSVGGSIQKILHSTPDPPSVHAPDLPPALDHVVLQGLENDPEKRFATARDMAEALAAALPAANPLRVGDWVQSIAGGTLRARAEVVTRIQLEKNEFGREPDAVGSILQSRSPSIPTLPEGAVAADLARRRGLAENELTSQPVHSDVFDSPQQRQKRRRAIGAIAALGALGVAAAILVTLYAARSAPAVAAASALPSASVGVAPSASAQSVASAASDSPAPNPAGEGTRPATTPVAPPPTASDIPPRGASRAPPKASPSPKATATVQQKRVDCEIPYVIDANGTKRFKPQCF